MSVLSYLFATYEFHNWSHVSAILPYIKNTYGQISVYENTSSHNF